MNTSAIDWDAANQRCLVHAMDAARVRLEGGDATAGESSESAPALEADEVALTPALDLLCAAFGLSPFERDVLRRDHGTPEGGVLAQLGIEQLRRAGIGLQAIGFQLFCDFRLLHRGVGGRVQPFDDVARRTCGRVQRCPERR